MRMATVTALSITIRTSVDDSSVVEWPAGGSGPIGTLGAGIRLGRRLWAAAVQRKTVIVRTLGFDGHIVCDARARSEIVVPVFDGDSELIAVLDVDSADVASFDQRDADGLERIVSLFTRVAGHRGESQ